MEAMRWQKPSRLQRFFAPENAGRHEPALSRIVLIIHHGTGRGRPLHPRVIAAGGDTQDAAHHGDGVTGPVLAHELESLGGITSVSRANQAAAFERISRSNLSWRFSRRRRPSSSR